MPQDDALYDNDAVYDDDDDAVYDADDAVYDDAVHDNYAVYDDDDDDDLLYTTPTTRRCIRRRRFLYDDDDAVYDNTVYDNYAVYDADDTALYTTTTTRRIIRRQRCLRQLRCMTPKLSTTTTLYNAVYNDEDAVYDADDTTLHTPTTLSIR